jgi:hypothetical protein
MLIQLSDEINYQFGFRTIDFIVQYGNLYRYWLSYAYCRCFFIT